MRLLAGTRAGLFLLSGDASWKHVRRTGPLLARRLCGPLTLTANGTLLIAAGEALFASRDGRHWTRTGALPEGMRCSCLASVGDALYAGTEPAALFMSGDQGRTWEEIAGVRRHPTADEWWGPWRLPRVQAILSDPHDATHLYIGISVAGVFHGRPVAPGDGDSGWEARNDGIAPMYPRDSRQDAVHRDIQNLAHIPLAGAGASAGLLAATAHGLYVSRDGQTWGDLRADWARWGVRALAVAPGSGVVFAVPLGDGGMSNGPVVRGQLTVYRSRDGARTWEPLTSGLPAEAGCFVHRDALAVGVPGSRGSAALYLGTSEGSISWSGDEGEHWALLATGLPSIHAVLPLPGGDTSGAPGRRSLAWPFSRR